MSRRMSFFVCVVGIVTVVSSAGALRATTINVDFNLPSGTAGTYAGLGAYADVSTNTYWNGLTVLGAAGGDTLTNLKASDGVTATPVSITLNTGVVDDTASYGFPAGLAPALMSDYTYTNGTFTIGGLVAGGKYQLYLYSQNAWGGCKTEFGVGAVTATAVNGSHLTSFVPGENYAVLSNLTADGAGTLSGSATMLVGGGAAIFNGVQIVSQVPEPGTLFLLVTCLLGLLAYAWRKRR